MKTHPRSFASSSSYFHGQKFYFAPIAPYACDPCFPRPPARRWIWRRRKGEPLPLPCMRRTWFMLCVVGRYLKLLLVEYDELSCLGRPTCNAPEVGTRDSEQELMGSPVFKRIPLKPLHTRPTYSITMTMTHRRRRRGHKTRHFFQ